jgi:hypothetical protein
LEPEGTAAAVGAELVAVVEAGVVAGVEADTVEL